MIRRRLAEAVGLVLVLLVTATSAGAQTLFEQGQDPLAGSRVFGMKGCVKCHSINGIGGKIGPDLARVMHPRNFFDLATAMWNHLPRMADRMRQAGITRPTLDAHEAADLVAFLYTLNYFDRPGNPEVGRHLFATKHCILCHQVGGVGGVVGPNLDHLRMFRSPIYVVTEMWNHGAAMADVMKSRGVQRPTFTGDELRDLVAFLAGANGPAEGPLYVLPGRVGEGSQLFVTKRCVECHAIAGQGGHVGPDLYARGVRQSPVELAAAMWNKAPAMLAAMKPRGITAPRLRADEMADIVAYLYSVGYFAGTGSVSNGWKVAADKGCLVCHGVRGERGKPASDLAAARGLDSPAAVLAALWNHTLVTAPSPAGGKTPWPEFRPDEMRDLVAMLESLGRGRR